MKTENPRLKVVIFELEQRNEAIGDRRYNNKVFPSTLDAEEIIQRS